MKIAYFSPFNPLKSGISDFSEELVPYLYDEMELDIFCYKGIIENKWISENIKILPFEKYHDDNIRQNYDLAVFHMGNNYAFHKEISALFIKYGGILELHDIALHHFLAESTVAKNEWEEYIEIMEYCHGKKGREIASEFQTGKISAPWENLSMQYTVNKHYVDRARAVITHSDFAKQMIKGEDYKNKVINIPLHTPDIYDDFIEKKLEGKEKLNIEKNKIIFCAFGYASHNKRIIPILQALRKFKKYNTDFHFYIVGKVMGINIEQYIKDEGLREYVTVTGFVTLDKFKEYMQACDIAFNLRYPTQGESSASLHRLLGMGKAVIVTRIGTFSEYPDDIVKKVDYGSDEVNEILDAIMELTTEKKSIDEWGKWVVQYAKENYSLEKNAKKYRTFFEAILNDDFIDEYEDELMDRLFKFGCADENYISHINGKLF